MERMGKALHFQFAQMVSVNLVQKYTDTIT